MRRFLSILIILIAIVFAEAFECSAAHAAAIQDNASAEVVSSCFREILQEGDMEEVTKLAANLHQKHQKLLILALQSEMQRLRQLQGELILGESTLQPVIKWGQNISHVFINIKTSHRWDSPPCLNSKKQKVFLNQSLLQYTNICVVSQQKLTFALNINLYKLANINGQKGENGQLLHFKVSKNGVGMSSAVFEKLQYDIWPFLNKQEGSYAIWAEMAERYPTDHHKYEELSRKIAKQRKPKTVKYEKSFFLCVSLLILLLFI